MGDTTTDIIEGYCCQWCNTYFDEPKGYPTLCRECESELNPKQKKKYKQNQQKKKQKSSY